MKRIFNRYINPKGNMYRNEEYARMFENKLNEIMVGVQEMGGDIIYSYFRALNISSFQFFILYDDNGNDKIVEFMNQHDYLLRI